MDKSKQLIVKSNQLIEARYEFSIWETRVFAKMVTMIKKEDKNFKNYRIEIKELMKFFDSKSHNDYNRIREVPESLMKKIIRIPYVSKTGEKRLFLTPLITNATTPDSEEIQDRNSYVELTFHPDLKPYLLELKGRFLKYDISNVLRISSPYSVRIYELLKQYEPIGHRTILLEELKEILGLQNKYQRYTHFKSGILLKAQKNLKKHTDICFNFKEIKEGKSVKTLKFLIFSNKTNVTKSKKTTSKKGLQLSLKVAEMENETLQKLVGEGITYEMAQSLIENLGAAIVEKELKFAKSKLQKKNGIQNPAGFLIRMIEKETFTKLKKQKDSQSKKAKESAKAKETERALQQKQVEDLRGEYIQARNLAVNILLKGQSKKSIKDLVEECAQKKPFIKKAILQAEKAKDTNTANEFKYFLVAQELEDQKLRDFETYLALEYKMKIERDERGEYLRELAD